MKRLPFGVSAAPLIFQAFIDPVLVDILGTSSYLDDIIAHGMNMDEYSGHLPQVFTRLKETHLKLQQPKWKLALSEFFSCVTDFTKKDNIQRVQRSKH